VATVLVDAENVRRSLWPNLDDEELEVLAAKWGETHGHAVVVVWEAARESADDRIARDALVAEEPVWVVTSDRALRERVRSSVDRFVGGGTFARELVRQPP
jgi:predicted RNA-binding protein with PIN domain